MQEKRSDAVESVSVSKNGVVNAKHRGHYQIKDQPSASPGSSSRHLPTEKHHGGRHDEGKVFFNGTGLFYGEDFLERILTAADRKPQYHQDNASVKSHGSSSRRMESPTSKSTRKHVNGERLTHGVVSRNHY